MSGTVLQVEAIAGSILGAIGQGFNTTPVSLGSIAFLGVEVPSEIARTGGQSVVVRKRPGGARTINRLGPDPSQRTLAGMFTGPTALGRSQAMEAMRDAGATVTLAYLGSTEQVVVTSYSARYTERGAIIPFTVMVEVLPVLAAIATGTPLSTSVGAYSNNALTAVVSALASAAVYVAGGNGSTVGEVATVASVAAGPLTAMSVDLASAAALTAGTMPPLATFTTTAQQAGADTMSTIAASSGSLLGIAGTAPNGIASDALSLDAVAAHAGILAAAVQAGGYINASLAGVSQQAGTVQALPVVHS